SSFHRTSVPLLRFALSNHPPRTTLFPYTALFRSVHHADPQRLVQNPLRDYADAERLAGAGARNDAERLALRSPARERLAVLAHEDRKSTRLNSSHVKNSYAVFCCKKKRQTQRQPY